MRILKWLSFLILCIVGNAGLGYGQAFYFPPAPDSILQTEVGSSRLGINTFNQYSNALLFYQGKKNIVNFSQRNGLIYNQAVSGNRFITNDLDLNFNYGYIVNSWLRTGVKTHFLRYGANNTTLAKNLAYLDALKNYNRQGWRLRLSTGSLTDNRNTFNNSGLGAEYAGAYYLISPDSGTTFKLESESGYYDIAPRNTWFTRAVANIEQTFDQNAAISLSAGYYSRKVEDYLLGNIQSISSDTLVGIATIAYRISDKLNYNSQNYVGLPRRDFNYRSFEGSNPRQNIYYTQQMVDTRQELTAQFARFKGTAQFLYTLTDRAYFLNNNLLLSRTDLDAATKDEQRKDIREASTSWIYELSFQLNDKDVLIAKSTAQLFRVDTRSIDNNQDRDEVLYSGELNYQRRWNSIFQTEFRLASNLRQLVYITPQQSNENYTERMIRLEPNFILGTKKLRWRADYSIQSTYNVRNFATEQLKNRSNRIFLTNHNIDATLTKRWHTLIDFTRRENRLSLLNWSEFKESPLDTVVIYDASIRFQYYWQNSKGSSVQTFAGYRYFRQTRQNEVGLSTETGGVLAIALDNIILQHGPRFGLSWQTSFGLYCYMDLWLQTNRVYYRYDPTTRIYLGQSYTAEQLAQQQNQFLPYFTITARYNLSAWRSLLR
jgi:hypothetical protein